MFETTKETGAFHNIYKACPNFGPMWPGALTASHIPFHFLV